MRVKGILGDLHLEAAHAATSIGHGLFVVGLKSLGRWLYLRGRRELLRHALSFSVPQPLAADPQITAALKGYPV